MKSMTRRLDLVLGLMVFAAAPRSEAKSPEKRAPRAVQRATPSGPASFTTRGGGAIAVTTAQAPTCTPRWGSLAHAELDRCIDGDGDGCATIGNVYSDACDSYSSIKWYRRGCRLGSVGACDALGRLNEPVPPPANP